MAIIFDDPINPTVVPEVQGSIREDVGIPTYVVPLDVDILNAKPVLPPIDYTNLDFSSIKLQLLNLLRANSKVFGYSIRDFSDANTAGMLLNLTAYMGQMISYHADAMVNELFLDTSQSSWSTFRLLNMYGYKPTRPQPGMVLLAVIRRPSSSGNASLRELEDNSEITFSNSLNRKRFTFGSESFEIFPAKDDNGTLVPDLMGNFTIPAYIRTDSTDNPDYQVEEMRNNMHLCFGLTGKTVSEDFISNGSNNQVIKLGSGPVLNTGITVQVEDDSVPKRTGKTTYKTWNELTYLSLAGFRTATRIGTAMENKAPYLISSFRLSTDALNLKTNGLLKPGTIMSVGYDNTVSVAKYQDFSNVLVPYQTGILSSLSSDTNASEEYVDILLYHPSYAYGDNLDVIPDFGTQSTLVNYVYSSDGNKIYWEPGDILYLLNHKYVGSVGSDTNVYQPQIISDNQIALADSDVYPDIAYLYNNSDQKIAIGRALSKYTLAFGISADYDTYIESDEIYEITTDGDFFASVKFGDGVFGKVPKNGAAIKIRYRVNDERATGNIVRATEANQTVSVGGVDLLIRNDYDSAPSVNGEDYRAAKELATRFFASQDRAVTGTDYTILVKKFNSNYKVATALSKADADGSVIRIYTLARRYGNSLEKLEPLSLVEKLQLREYLNAYKCIGASLEFVDGFLRPLDIRIDVRVRGGHLTGQVKADIQNVVAAFFDYNKLEMGMGFKATDFIREVTAVSGIESCDMYLGGLETLNLDDGTTVILGNRAYQHIKDIPAYSDNLSAFPKLGATLLGIEETTKRLKPYEMIVLNSLTVNAVSGK